MARPIWLALILLIGICILAALKIGIAAPPQTTFADDVIEVVPVNALAKTDKLEIEETPYKKSIQSIPIVPEVAAPIPGEPTKMVRHRLEDGFAEAKVRKHHYRHVSRQRLAALKAKGK